MKTKILALIGMIGLGATAAKAGPAAHGGEGHGGDPHMLLFENARREATEIVRYLHDGNFPQGVDPRVKSWLLEHQADLVADITASVHDWEHAYPNQSTCARTELTSMATIAFKLEVCKQAAVTLLDAATTLVHESVHHFGIDDEAFATKVAVAATSAKDYQYLQTYGVWEILTTKNPCPNAKNNDADLKEVKKGDSIFFTIKYYMDGKTTDGEGKEIAPCTAIYDVVKNEFTQLPSPELAPDFGLASLYSVGDDVYLLTEKFVGVNPGDAWVYRVIQYSSSTNQWQPVGDELSYFQASFASFDKGLMVWGGVDKELPSADGYIFSTESNTWVPMSKTGMPAARFFRSQAWTGKEFVIYGGMLDRDMNHPATDAAAFNPNTNVWRSIKAPPQQGQFDFGASVLAGNQIIYINNRLLYRYNVEADQWLAPVSIPAVVGPDNFEIMVWADKFLISRDYMYDPASNRWFAMSGSMAELNGAGKRNFWVQGKVVNLEYFNLLADEPSWILRVFYPMMPGTKR